MTLLTTLLLSILPQSEPLRDRVDLVEVNHFHDEKGRLVFDQVIFYVLRPETVTVQRCFIDTTKDFTWTSTCINGETIQHMAPRTVLVSYPQRVQRDYEVKAWRLIKHPNQLPQRDRLRGGYVAIWQDGEVLRVVRSPLLRESWTQYDPESDERGFLPDSDRTELKQARPASDR